MMNHLEKNLIFPVKVPTDIDNGKGEKLEDIMIWAPEKRFETKLPARTENRFKSFRGS